MRICIHLPQAWIAVVRHTLGLLDVAHVRNEDRVLAAAAAEAGERAEAGADLLEAR